MTPPPPQPEPQRTFPARARIRIHRVARALVHYLRCKAMDIADIARDTREHPGSLPQNLAALVITLGTAGGNRLSGPGRFVLYENARGLGAWIPGIGRHTAITFGNIAFARKPCTQFSALYWHEQTHYLQSTEEGWRWALRYFRESRKHGYRGNRYEVEAYERGPRGAGSMVCERRPPKGPGGHGMA